MTALIVQAVAMADRENPGRYKVVLVPEQPGYLMGQFVRPGEGLQILWREARQFITPEAYAQLTMMIFADWTKNHLRPAWSNDHGSDVLLPWDPDSETE
jgi:hypothetical protein